MATYSLITFAPPNTSYVVRTAHTTEYFSKGIDNQGPYYNVEYIIDNYSDADNFINALMGFSTQQGGTSGPVTKTGPHQHPLAPNLYCRSAELAQGLGQPTTNFNGFPSYSGGALIRATYRPWLPYDYNQQQNQNTNIDPATPLLWCTQELDFTTETQVLPKTFLRWDNGSGGLGNPTNMNFAVQIGIIIMSLTFHRLPYIPMSAVRTCIGMTNSTTFMGAQAGRVLFTGAHVSREMDNSGAITQKVNMTFKERSQDWNKRLRPDDMSWQYVYGPNNYSPYKSTDLNALLQF